MAMRLLVSICCIVASSATGVWSESQFKQKYAAYVGTLDSAAVKAANAAIVGAAIPPEGAERNLHRWYHDVNAAVQADAKAIMGKTLADRSAVVDFTATDPCMTKIKDAVDAHDGDWDNLYPIYVKVSGDDVPSQGSDEVKTAQACVHALSGAERKKTLEDGFQSKLFGFFQTKMTTALNNVHGVDSVSKFVTGTLTDVAPSANTPEAEGKFTQPMYSVADATLRDAMMRAMVNRLKAQLPAV